MKNNTYITIMLAILLGFSAQAQDVSLTNTRLDQPEAGQEYGEACFTIIAEEGVAVTSIPMSVEISLSLVDFDSEGIYGFNSEKFDWEVDAFASNVIRGTLLTSIQDIDNGEGGARVCIPVKREKKKDYKDSRNGFQVNIVPGSLNQNGNTSNDEISRFVFADPSGSPSFTAVQDDYDVVINYEDPAAFKSKKYVLQRAINDGAFSTLATFNATLFSEGHFEFIDYDVDRNGNDKVAYQVTKEDYQGNYIKSDIKEFDLADHEIKVFPNPAFNVVNIHSGNNDDNNSMIIYNLAGQVVHRINRFNKSERIQVLNWESGFYIAEIRDDKNQMISSSKFIVAK